MSEMKTGLSKLDKLAYHAVCNWSKEIGFDPVYNGIDYSQIIRFYLWDKVGRALRLKDDEDKNEIAAYKEEYNTFPFYYTPYVGNGSYRKKWFHSKKVIYFPSHPSKLLVESLERIGNVKVVYKGAHFYLGPKRHIHEPVPDTNYQLASIIHTAVMESMRHLEIELINEDIGLLKSQIEGAIQITDLAEKELVTYKPNGIFVHSDNHPPFINYVLVAKKLGIPSFTYQHGLDCEHYYLDDCYADYVAVWSEQRKARYLSDSIFQPKSIKAIGNFLLKSSEHLKSSREIKRILYVTRPHRPIKCYSPSRVHTEGIEIVSAILDFLLQNESMELFIKPHPLDSTEEYVDLITSFGLESRVKIINDRLSEIFTKVDAVVTEDSTAGAEALQYGLPLVHAHLAYSEPVLPFVQYKCALPGRTKKEIIVSLQRMLGLSEEEKNKMNSNGQRFVEDFIPEGKVDDLVHYIVNNI